MITSKRYIDEEQKKIDTVRKTVDDAARKLAAGNLSESGIQKLLKETREKVLDIFPDKEEVYELIYTPRFKRIMEEVKRRRS